MKDPEITAGYDQVPDRTVAVRELFGRDAIVLQDGKQVTRFREGILPWSLQTPPPVRDYELINEHQPLPMKIYTGRRKKHELSI